MATDKYMTKSEMKTIATLCEDLDALHAKVSGLSEIYVTIFVGVGHEGKIFDVFDTNGDLLGHIGMTDDGFGLYLDGGDE